MVGKLVWLGNLGWKGDGASKDFLFPEIGEDANWLCKGRIRKAFIAGRMSGWEL